MNPLLSSSQPKTPPDFSNPATRIKINPETYIRFEGDKYVLLGNVHSDDKQGMRVQSDILLVLWDVVDWKTMGDIFRAWQDPSDHQKIMNYMQQFYDLSIIITDESEEPGLKDEIPSDDLASQQHFNVENHLLMLQDHVRLASYRRAIERAVTKETVALDLGCGTGILGFFAHMAGAQKVYGIERRTDILELTQAIADDNGFDRMQFFGHPSGHVQPEEMDPRPNLLVAEILGDSVLDEHILEFTLDARDRLLAPHATLIPYKLDIYVFAFHADINPERGPAVDELKDLYGVDYRLLGEVLKRKPITVSASRFNPRIERAITDPVLAQSINFYELQESTFEVEFDLPVKTDGRFGGYGTYFKAWLDEETILTNSPWAPQTHWTHLLFYRDKPSPVSVGDTIKLKMTYDDQIKIDVINC